MNNDKFYYIFLALAAFICFLPNFYIGPISVRSISIIVLSIISIFCVKYARIDLCIKLYLAYLVVHILLSFVNGYASDMSFSRQLFAGHLPSLLFCITIPIFVNTRSRLKLFSYVLLLIWLFDCIVSIGQYLNIGLAWNIGSLINTAGADRLEGFESHMDSLTSLLGQSIVFGIFGSVVANGYFITMFAPLGIKEIFTDPNNQSKFTKIITYAISIIAITAIFMLQQRMGFLLLAPFLGYYIFRGSNLSIKLIVIIAIAFLFLNNFIADFDFGRLLSTDDDIRKDAYTRAFDVIFDTNIFYIGGMGEYMKYFDYAPHNTLIGAWIYGGIIGLIVYCVCLYSISVNAYNGIKTDDKYIKAYSWCVLLFIIYSMTHSSGIHNGFSLFWLTYVMMETGKNIDQEIIVI